MKVKVYNQEGKEVEELELPTEVFGVKIKKDLVHQAMVAQIANSRQVIAHAKDRSEVRGGGKKPWRQKGTGRARHGSIRSPIWIGGGATFGPTKERNFSKKINKKMKRKALFMVLSGKAQNSEIVVLDNLSLEQPKTKEMARVMKDLGKIKKDITKGALLATADKDKNIVRAAGNIPKLSTVAINSLNIVDLLSHRYLVINKEDISKIKEIFLK